jgi:hypothetical protein
VRRHPVEGERSRAGDLAGKVKGVLGHAPNSAHPGIDLKVDGNRPSPRASLAGKILHEVRVDDERGELVLDDGRDFLRYRQAERKDRGDDAGFAEVNPLLNGGDGEVGRAPERMAATATGRAPCP